MAGIINYAKENGVGVILWSSWRNLVQRGHEKMEEIMKYYGDMGVTRDSRWISSTGITRGLINSVL